MIRTFRLLGDLTLRGILHPKHSTIELDDERDARVIAWLRERGVLPSEGEGVMVQASIPRAEPQRRALRPWSSGCCGGRR